MPDNSNELNCNETATLGGGCFWCLEAVFQDVIGILHVQSGYAGGHVSQPTYEQVCSGKTGHAEVVQIEFDNRKVSFTDILEIFFTIHDPTTLNRQGADIGTQYRSVIFYHSEEQKSIAQKVIAGMVAEKIWLKPVVTEITPYSIFYPAEDYHKDYYNQNKGRPYCSAVISPKLGKFRQKFLKLTKSLNT